MDEKDLNRLKENSGSSSAVKENLFIEILRDGKECPNCHFAKLKREGQEIFCPVCGYGYRPCT